LRLDAVDSLVGQVFGSGAAAAQEDSDELAADFLVALAGAIAVGIQPREQSVEGLLAQGPRAFHQDCTTVRKSAARPIEVMTASDE